MLPARAFGVWGLGLSLGFGVLVWCLDIRFRVGFCSLGFKAQGSCFRFQALELRLPGFKLKVPGSGVWIGLRGGGFRGFG